MSFRCGPRCRRIDRLHSEQGVRLFRQAIAGPDLANLQAHPKVLVEGIQPFLNRTVHGFARNGSRQHGAAVVEPKLEAMRKLGPADDLSFERIVPVFDAQTLDAVASAGRRSAVRFEVAFALNQAQARAFVVEGFEKLFSVPSDRARARASA